MKHPHTRAARRAARFHVIARRRHQVRWLTQSLQWAHDHLDGQERQDWFDEALGRIAKTPCPCSCTMCGNPRRHGWDQKLTLAEQKCLDIMEDGLNDWHKNAHDQVD